MTILNRQEKITDQTENFPVFYFQRCSYLINLYNYNINSILSERIEYIKNEEIICAYKKLHKALTKCGVYPKLQGLDNKASPLIKDETENLKVYCKFVSPLIDHKNTSKRSVITLQESPYYNTCRKRSQFSTLPLVQNHFSILHNI